MGNKVYSRGVLEKVKELERGTWRASEEELIKETWSETRAQTESLAIRLDLRHKVSFSTAGTGDFKTHKHSARELPAGSSTGTMGLGHRAESRLGRTSWGRGGQSPEAAAPPAPAAPLQRCRGRPCPSGQAAASTALPRANTRAQILLVCFNPHRPQTHRQIENAEELILRLLI